METGREDRVRLLATVALVVLAAVVVASWSGGSPGAPPDDAGELEIVRATEALVDAGRPFAVAGGRLVSLACDGRCRLLVGAAEAGAGTVSPGSVMRTILLPPGAIEWRVDLPPVASPDGRRLAFTLVQDGVPRTAVVDLESGTLLVRSTSFVDEARLDELRWDDTGRGVLIPRVIGGDLLWMVATSDDGASPGRAG